MQITQVIFLLLLKEIVNEPLYYGTSKSKKEADFDIRGFRPVYPSEGQILVVLLKLLNGNSVPMLNDEPEYEMI